MLFQVTDMNETLEHLPILNLTCVFLAAKRVHLILSGLNSSFYIAAKTLGKFTLGYHANQTVTQEQQ